MTKNSRPIIRIYTTSDEFIDREMNDTEFAQYQKDQENHKALKAEAEAKAAEKQAIADRLGLTLDELKLLLG
jgi:hypothetical protein